MRVITVARKPLSEGNVASNVLKHGTGSLNIGASRIKADSSYGDNAVTQGGDHFSVGSPDKTRGTRFQPSSDGRWPPNLILQHLPGCRKGDPVRIQSKNATFVHTKGGEVKARIGMGGMKREAPGQYGHADADGMESVDTWECVSGCPVADLGAQTGILKSGSLDPGHGSGNSFGVGNTDKKPRPIQQSYGGDTGTAARFFKQVQSKEEA